MRYMYGRIVYIPQDQRELYTCIPVLRGFLFPSLLEVKRSMIDLIAVRKEENPPKKPIRNNPSSRKEE
jgi:hypothetical protein